MTCILLLLVGYSLFEVFRFVKPQVIMENANKRVLPPVPVGNDRISCLHLSTARKHNVIKEKQLIKCVGHCLNIELGLVKCSVNVFAPPFTMTDVYIETQVDYLLNVWTDELKNYSADKLREYTRKLVHRYAQDEDYKVWKLQNPLAHMLSEIFGPESDSFKTVEDLNPIQLCQRYWWNRCRKYYERRVISDKNLFQKLSDRIRDEKEDCDEAHFIEAAMYHFQKLALKSSLKNEPKLYGLRKRIKKHPQFQGSDLPKKFEPKEVADVSKDYFLLRYLIDVLKQPRQRKAFVRFFLDTILTKNKFVNLRLMFQLMLKCEEIKIEPVRMRDEHFERSLSWDAALTVAIREGRIEIIEYLFDCVKDYFRGYSIEEQRERMAKYLKHALNCYLLWTFEPNDSGLEKLFELGFKEEFDMKGIVMDCIYFGKTVIRQTAVKLNSGGRKELRAYYVQELTKYGADPSELIRSGDKDSKLFKACVKVRSEVLFRKYIELAMKIQKLDVDNLLKPDRFNRTLLHYSVVYNLDQGVELILSLAETSGFQEATLLGPDNDGRSPAFLAIAGRKETIINLVFKFYVDHGMQMKIYLDWDGNKSEEKQVILPGEITFWRKISID